MDRHPIVACLRDRLKDWRSAGEGVALFPKEASFDVMYVVRRRLSFFLSFDYKWDFSTHILVFDEGDMDDDRRALYRRLKGMECELEWKGMILRRPRFKSYSKLRRMVPMAKPSAVLIELLNGNERLMKAISASKLDEIYVNTYYEAPGGVSPARGILEFYNNPSKVGWIIRATKGPGGEFRFKRTVNEIFNVFDILSKELRLFTLSEAQV